MSEEQQLGIFFIYLREVKPRRTKNHVGYINWPSAASAGFKRVSRSQVLLTISL